MLSFGSYRIIHQRAYGQVQIKCDEMPKNEVSQFMENLCPFCAAEFVDPKNVMVILLTHISFKKKID